ncbi:hypothetical protein [Pseudoxanthomonas suwonensis]|uniref:hypothetical protein n=1 Tax=Pseudoxanthomonas suwonensis TaxID=314722 RepID=UPI000AD5D648|nr:hypothetical protein [Pseudoxanthomonas suwonensis]
MKQVSTIAFLSILLVSSPTLPVSGGQDNRRLVLSLPAGGCTLMMFPDGSGRIHYGAAPWVVHVAAHTFDFEHALQSFLPNALPWRARGQSDIELAGVTFPGTNETSLTEDTVLVRSLLEQGWEARLPPETEPDEGKAHARIKGACDFK